MIGRDPLPEGVLRDRRVQRVNAPHDDMAGGAGVERAHEQHVLSCHREPCAAGRDDLGVREKSVYLRHLWLKKDMHDRPRS